MKRALSLILAIMLCLGLCACNRTSKFFGTYKQSTWYVLPTTVGYMGGKLHTERPFEGEATLVINSDGTGIERFVANEYNGDTEVLIFECPVAWKVVDEYLYVTGSCTYKISNEKHRVDDRYRLEGKTLIDADNSDSKYMKQ